MSKTKEIQELLRKKLLISVEDDDRNLFSGGVFLTEVTHIQKRTRADALFIGMTNQSGRRLDGYEIKISRGDWLRELRSPTKADAWADECQSWTIVADEGVVKLDELPEGFGLLERRERKTIRLVQVVKPRIIDNRIPSWDAMFSIISTVEREKRKSIDVIKKAAAQEYSELRTELVKLQRAKLPNRINERAEHILEALEHEFGTIADPKANKLEFNYGMDIMKVITTMKPFLDGEEKISRIVGNDFYGVTSMLEKTRKQLVVLQNEMDKIQKAAKNLK
ncbi:MAG: hypothetical protein H9W81_17830 [Enterococcus sp.]|nr:hypothetical protein [Enterococcus sp.]